MHQFQANNNRSTEIQWNSLNHSIIGGSAFGAETEPAMSKCSCVSRMSQRLLLLPPRAQTVATNCAHVSSVSRRSTRIKCDLPLTSESASVNGHRCDTGRPTTLRGIHAGGRKPGKTPVRGFRWSSKTVSVPWQRLHATIGFSVGKHARRDATRTHQRACVAASRARASAFPTRKVRESHRTNPRSETRARPFRRAAAVTTRRRAARRGSTTRSGGDVSSTPSTTATSWCRRI